MPRPDKAWRGQWLISYTPGKKAGWVRGFPGLIGPTWGARKSGWHRLPTHLPPHRDAGEGEHREPAHRLAKAPRRLEDAPQQQVLNLRARHVVGRTGDDAVVVHLARAVDISLDHHRA